MQAATTTAVHVTSVAYSIACQVINDHESSSFLSTSLLRFPPGLYVIATSSIDNGGAVRGVVILQYFNASNGEAAGLI